MDMSGCVGKTTRIFAVSLAIPAVFSDLPKEFII
jgi:hypothetical protein